jgi:hypothetical protein
MVMRRRKWAAILGTFLGAAAAGTSAVEGQEVRSPYQGAAPARTTTLAARSPYQIAGTGWVPVEEQAPSPPPQVGTVTFEPEVTAPAPCGPRPSWLQRCKRNVQSCFLGFPGEFEAAPLGASVYLNGRTEVANGEAARMVLHQYDFVEGSAQLNPRGKDQLARIAGYLPRNFFPIIVERTPETASLAESRRLVVLNELARGTFPVPPERVVIGPDLANGLKGIEAEIIYRNLLDQTRISGTPIPPSSQSGAGISSGRISVPPGIQ